MKVIAARPAGASSQPQPPPPRGFTLIEIMVVVAMIGILSTLAIPTYMDRVIRTQVSEGLGLAEFARQAVQESWKRHGRMPLDNAAAGLPEARSIVGNYVTQVEVHEGVVSITFGQRSNRFLAGKRLSLRPAVVKAHPAVPIAWVCGRATVPERMSTQGANLTDLPVNHLPIDCRG
jgi:type IV pilus assembly protein PilA